MSGQDMSFEVQSEDRIWIDLGSAATDYTSPLKLTISEVARLYRVLDAALRDYSARSTDILSVLPDELPE